MKKDKKIAVVTGGSRGIGLSICKQFIADGFEVIATYKNEKNIKDWNKNINLIQWDASNYKESKKQFKKLAEKYKKIDVLVNNAAITKDVKFEDMAFEDWQKVLINNLDSCFVMSQLALPMLKSSNFGRIINISSVNALSGQIGQTNYCASKAGIIGFTKALAKELAKYKITVNAIAPGYIDTRMTEDLKSEIKDKIISQIPLKSFGKAEDVANMVRFISNENSGYITGQVFSVNGGLYM